jgi:hypothetical protein
MTYWVVDGAIGLGMFKILGSQLFFQPDLVQNRLLSRILKAINKIINIQYLDPTHLYYQLLYHFHIISSPLNYQKGLHYLNRVAVFDSLGIRNRRNWT